MKASTLVKYTRQRVLDASDQLGSKRKAANAIAGFVEDLNPEWVYRFALGLYDNPRADSLDMVIRGLDAYENRREAAA